MWRLREARRNCRRQSTAHRRRRLGFCTTHAFLKGPYFRLYRTIAPLGRLRCNGPYYRALQKGRSPKARGMRIDGPTENPPRKPPQAAPHPPRRGRELVGGWGGRKERLGARSRKIRADANASRLDFSRQGAHRQVCKSKAR